MSSLLPIWLTQPQSPSVTLTSMKTLLPSSSVPPFQLPSLFLSDSATQVRAHTFLFLPVLNQRLIAPTFDLGRSVGRQCRAEPYENRDLAEISRKSIGSGLTESK